MIKLILGITFIIYIICVIICMIIDTHTERLEGNRKLIFLFPANLIITLKLGTTLWIKSIIKAFKIC